MGAQHDYYQHEVMVTEATRQSLLGDLGRES
jgi:hypothetical protein